MSDEKMGPGPTTDERYPLWASMIGTRRVHAVTGGVYDVMSFDPLSGTFEVAERTRGHLAYEQVVTDKVFMPYEQVDHPAHYGGKDNVYEAIKVIEAWGLDFCLGNTVKYISRAGKKSSSPLLEDLKKARWYLDRAIKRLERD